jgi:hypothetical protein
MKRFIKKKKKIINASIAYGRRKAFGPFGFQMDKKLISHRSKNCR